MNNKKLDSNNEEENCCYPDCNSSAEPLSNYCKAHQPSNYQFNEKRTEMLMGQFSMDEITKQLLKEKIERSRKNNPYIEGWE